MHRKALTRLQSQLHTLTQLAAADDKGFAQASLSRWSCRKSSLAGTFASTVWLQQPWRKHEISLFALLFRY